MGWCSNVFHIIAIGYEFADKFFDGVTVSKYRELFYHPKKPVYNALFTFMIIGCMVSIARIYLYIQKMLCIDDGDDGDDGDEGKRNRRERYELERYVRERYVHERSVHERSVHERDRGKSDQDKSCFGRLQLFVSCLLQLFAFRLNLDSYYQYDVCVHAVKVIIEAFPQSVIAYIALDDCPMKTSKWKFADRGFDVFCIAPYVIFTCSMIWWYRCYNEGNKGKYMSALTALATVVSIPGFVLASIALKQSVKCP